MRFSGVFFLSFLFIAGAIGGFHSRHAAWETGFEKEFAEALPLSAPARDAWGQAEYAAFREGRAGVVVGQDGWLFTAEEFSCPKGAAGNVDKNLSLIADTKARLKDINLVIVPIPSKSAIHVGNLSPCRRNVYKKMTNFFREHAIAHADLLNALSREGAYLRTDTHWSPAGALAAAEEARKAVTASLPQKLFISRLRETKTRAGDLMRYVPGADIPPDSYRTAATEAVGGELLDDEAMPAVVLVGTSYSAAREWNFEGFLKETLRADILNVAEEGRGPFAVMEKYLNSAIFRDHPPRLVIWEIPERYLPL